MNGRSDRTTLLRWSLRLDGIASGFCGALLLAAASPLAALVGVSAPGPLRVLGALLLVFGAALLGNARRPRPRPGEARLTVLLNAAWVAASVAVLLAGRLTAVGNLLVAAVAALVLLFLLLELRGLRRLRGAPA